MAFCANCGNKVGDTDKFCASCGTTRVAGAPAAQPVPPLPPPVYQAAPVPPQTPPPVYNAPMGGYQQPAPVPMAAGASSGESSTGLKANVAGLLCYVGVWITGIIFLVLEKKSSFVRFHAAQSLVTFGLIGILNIFLGTIFSRTWFLSSFLNGLIGLGAFILWIVLMVKAYQGETYKLPIVGDIAAGIAKV